MSDLTPDQSTEKTTCCGGPAVENAQACCREDELAKKDGENGCGCSSKTEKASNPNACCQ